MSEISATKVNSICWVKEMWSFIQRKLRPILYDPVVGKAMVICKFPEVQNLAKRSNFSHVSFSFPAEGNVKLFVVLGLHQTSIHLFIHKVCYI